jgi:hypothetical protein
MPIVYTPQGSDCVYNVGMPYQPPTVEEIHEALAELVSTAVLRGVPYEFTKDLADVATRLRLLIEGAR